MVKDVLAWASFAFALISAAFGVVWFAYHTNLQKRPDNGQTILSPKSIRYQELRAKYFSLSLFFAVIEVIGLLLFRSI